MPNKHAVRDKVLAVLAGVCAGLFIAEAAARAFLGNPPPLAYDRDAGFYWDFIDIHDDFFAKDAALGRYVNRRPGSRDASFDIRKRHAERRIFIIGESVAYYYDGNDLEEAFRRRVPGIDWKVINCGMIGYDSYRIALTAKQAVRYEPDLIVLMMGNNEAYRRVSQVNDWVYRYRVLSYFWTMRAITDRLRPVKPVRDPEKTFEANLRKIIRAAASRGIPLVVCTLPLNHKVPFDLSGDRLSDREYFSVWWLAQKNPRKAVRGNWAAAPGGASPNMRFRLAQAYERCGESEKAQAIFRTLDRGAVYNGLIRKTVAESGGTALLADFDARLKKESGGQPGFEFFCDTMHYWPAVYAKVTREIIASLPGAADPRVRGLLQAGDGCGHSPAPGPARRSATARSDYFAHRLNNAVLSDTFSFECVVEIMRAWFKVDGKDISAFAKRMHGKWDVPETAYYDCLIGEMLREEGLQGDALAYLRRAVAKDKDYFRGYLFRGLCHYERGDARIAEKDFVTLRKMKPEFRWLSTAFLDGLVNGPPGGKQR